MDAGECISEHQRLLPELRGWEGATRRARRRGALLPLGPENAAEAKRIKERLREAKETGNYYCARSEGGWEVKGLTALWRGKLMVLR